MERIINVKRKQSGVIWVSFQEGNQNEGGQKLMYKHHSRPRKILIKGKKETVVHCYYQPFDNQGKGKPYIVATHPDLIPNKKVSKSTFAQIIDLKYNQKWGKEQILKQIPISEYAYYESINSFRAASRTTADERNARKYPPGTKLGLSIDGTEMQKGQPGLYTVRSVGEGDLLAAAYLTDADADMLYQLVHGIEEKYGIVITGFISDKGRNIEAMYKQYYSSIPVQFCIVHFLKNATADMRDQDISLLKDLRSDVRNLSVLKTIKINCRNEDSPLAENEQFVLAETKVAVLAIVNQKKKEMFDLPSLPVYENLVKFQNWFDYYQQNFPISACSKKFKTLLTHFIDKIQTILDRRYENYRDIALMNYLIHPIFSAVREPHPRHPKRAFEGIKNKWNQIVENQVIPKNVIGAIETALNTASSYEKGLFNWKKAKLPSHNNDTEIFYHIRKGRYRRSSPNMQIGVTMELSGLEEFYIPLNLSQEEIRAIIEAIGTKKYLLIRNEMKVRSERRSFDRQCRNEICDVLTQIFKKLYIKI